MTESLFREEVLNKCSRRLAGDLIIHTSVGSRVLVLFLVLGLLSTLIFLVGNTYTRKQSVPGMLMPDKGMIDVFAAVNGKVTRIYASQGDVLEKDQLLVSVAEDHGQLGAESVLTALDRNLEREIGLVERQLQQITDAYALAEQKHSLETAALAEALVQEERVLDAELAMLDIQTRTLSRANRLAAHNALAARDLDASEYEVLVQRTRIETRKGDILALRRRLDQETIAARESDARFQEKKNLLQQQLNALEGEAIRFAASSSTDVIAPVGGLLSQLNVHEGMTVDTGQPLLSVLPENSRLQAWLQVPASAIGFLRPGQLVRIRYTTFAYQKFGVFDARVVSVPDSASQSSSRNGEPVYRVVAAIDVQSVMAYGEEIPLKAGTSLSADIVLDERNLLEWLLEPLYSIGLRS